MDSYGDFSGQTGFLEMGEDSGERSNQHQPHFAQPNTPSMGDAQNFYNANLQPSMICDIKPRLTKGQHEMLEGEYTKQNKPSTSTKKGFAEALGVSLDKVNNWFQNRRAKSKQDVKKAAGAYNLYQNQQAAGQLFNFSSDSDTSPPFASDDYSSMMQQCSSQNQSSDALGISTSHHSHGLSDFPPAAFTQSSVNHSQVHELGVPRQMPPYMFDSPQEINRRTLTQEQFDAIAQNGGSAELANFDMFNGDFPGHHNVLHQAFPHTHQGDVKQQHAYTFPNHVPPPLSSLDSTVPSTSSDLSMDAFPSSSSLRDAGSASSASSDWADSRSSSVCATYHDDPFSRTNVPQHPTSSTLQWRPGQSVPVDVTARSREFQQAAQARQTPSHYHTHEQPLAWPADNAYERRNSQTSSMLAQSMSHVGLQTPQSQQPASFKAPAPPSSIAARRQRPRPAALGIASMRSQSYSGAVPPGSPGQAHQQCLSPGQQQLRRIRSSNVVGGVAQGRIQKPLPGAPQRSPLAWSFADAMSSPKASRHASAQSNGTLAPPTPLSPNEFPRPEQTSSHTGWHPSHHGRQPSISEDDLEQVMPYAPVASVPFQNFSSPPHTPMYNQQGFLQQRIASSVITENTPPQSAPASQQKFSNSTYTTPYHHGQAYSQHSQVSIQHYATHPAYQQPQYMSAMASEPQYEVPSMPGQPANMVPTSSAYGNMPLQYPQGVPIVNANGQLELMVPPQYVQQAQHPALVPSQPQQMQTPPRGGQFEDMMGMFSTAVPAPAIQAVAPIPKQAPPTEFFVHEYSPPADLKQAATPRKTVDSGPKNYSFANHGPQDYEKSRRTKATATASSSPASSGGAAFST